MESAVTVQTKGLQIPETPAFGTFNLSTHVRPTAPMQFGLKFGQRF